MLLYEWNDLVRFSYLMRFLGLIATWSCFEEMEVEFAFWAEIRAKTLDIWAIFELYLGLIANHLYCLPPKNEPKEQ